MAATVIDVSKTAGCSPATVSRVLNNSGPVSQVVRERVHRAIRQSGYVPKNPPRQPTGRQAVSTHGEVVEAIDVVLYRHEPIEPVSIGQDGMQVGPMSNIPSEAMFAPAFRLSNSFYRHIVDGVLEELRRWKSKAVLQISDDLMGKDFLADLNTPEKRGMLLIGEYSPDLGKFVDSCKMPLVLVDLLYDGLPDVVTIDNHGGIASVVEHLVSLGHREIGFVGGAGNPSDHERRSSFTARMLEAGLSVRPEWMSEGSHHIVETTQRVTGLLKRSVRPTALVCCNDWLALGALRAAEQCEMRVPQDLSIAGFDDVDGAMFMSPALTTVRVPTMDLGRHAVRQLMVRCSAGEKAKSTRGCVLRVRTELVVRQSTGEPPR
ncbi:MAG TPA: hypothetical protein DCX07_10770 [Phycisphaerales bacterium]|nr:hypothetical protein [Phycisphaerales bacterium]